MKQDLPSYWPAILVKTGGMVIFVLALLKLPQALAALVQMVSVLWLRTYLGDIEDPGQALIANGIHTSGASSIGNLLAFIILFLTARWLFSYPAILRNWFQRTDDAFEFEGSKTPKIKTEQAETPDR